MSGLTPKRFLLITPLPNWLKNRIASFDDGFWEATEGKEVAKDMRQFALAKSTRFFLWFWGIVTVAVGTAAGNLLYDFLKRLVTQ